jgi:hypothetical protein
MPTKVASAVPKEPQSSRLVSVPTDVRTDHLNLGYLPSKPQLSIKQAVALSMLAPYNFTITYQEGRINPADPLSRRSDHNEPGQVQKARQATLPNFQARFVGVIRERHTRCAEIAPLMRVALAHADGALTLQEALLQAQEKDEFVTGGKWARSGSAKTSEGLAVLLWHRDKSTGLLMKGEQIYVPPIVRGEVMRVCHDSPSAGHLGKARTTARIAASYTWKGIKQDVKQYCRSCHICQTSKVARQPPYGPLQPLPVPNQPFEEITMDFVTDLPPVDDRIGGYYDSILVTVDRLTKWTEYIPCSKRVDGAQLGRIFLERIYSRFGSPKGIVSDRGTVFTSGWWQTFCEYVDVERRLSVAYHPQTDGQTERMNRVLEQYLRSYCSKEQDDWEWRHPLAQSAYNTSVHAVTRMTPAKMLLGYEPRTPANDVGLISEADVDALERVQRMEDDRQKAKTLLMAAQEYNKRRYDKKVTPHVFRVDDWVMLRTEMLITPTDRADPGSTLQESFI